MIMMYNLVTCFLIHHSNLCYDFMFFFFKQKTAYEMRISDWSSDVCSSDLGGGALHRPRPRRNDADLRGTRRFARLRPGGDSARRADEIGRASCRERVCQYV